MANSEGSQATERGATVTAEVGEVLAKIQSTDPEWRAGEAVALGGGLRWRPELKRDDRPAVLHVHLADRLRSYVVDRMRAARSSGMSVHLATPLSALYDEQLLAGLADLDVQVHVIRRGGEVGAPISLLACLSDESILVTPEARIRLATSAWRLRGRFTTA